MHPDHARITVAPAVKSAFAHQRITDRCVHKFRQTGHLLKGVRNDGSAAHIEVGPLCRPDVLRRLLQLLLSIGGGPADLLACRHRSVFADRGSHILGNIHQNRAGPPALSNVKSPPQRACQLFHVLDDITVLCDGHGHSRNVHLLKAVLAQHGKRHIGRNCHHGHRVHVRRSNTCHQIGGSGSAGGHTYTHPACGSCIAVRRMGGTLLMGGQDMPDLPAVLVQCIIDIQNGTAGISEHGVYSLLLQTFYYDLRTVQLHMSLLRLSYF